MMFESSQALWIKLTTKTTYDRNNERQIQSNNGWMDRMTNRQTDGQIAELTDRYENNKVGKQAVSDRQINVQTERQIEHKRQTDRTISRQTDRCGKMARWTEGQMDD